MTVETFINTKILSNPLNWATLAVWLFSFAIVSHALGFLTHPHETSIEE